MALHDVSVALAGETGQITFALRGVHLAVHPGEWLLVMGRNGSGKSTLGRVMAGLCGVSRGQVVRRPGASVRLVFQNPDAQLVGQTVAEDVAFGLQVQGLTPDEMERRSQAALRTVGLEKLRDQSVAHLSGGQKQLLCTASALALEPAVLVFDEATAMLDAGARQALRAVARRLCAAGAAVVWITQIIEELAWADRMVLLDEGRVVFEGTPRQFVTPEAGEDPPCQRFGFPLPWASAIAMDLRNRGVPLPRVALTEAELATDLQALCGREGEAGGARGAGHHGQGRIGPDAVEYGHLSG
ncbi:ATP-binding cassette domain-containing protein [Alicyclobacillus macrosporangiidus]|uniref:ATP-binding cassette domain-containing protein n=1 Tax=Alicyclobacillus macrosporangiidus TaxID=392015 RepID=UPI000945406E|nr:ATP-binding cassette domain-containing protein [Alicyclobacillus macrosporangiidus]